MPSNSYKIEAIVLKKTKLSENDLIITFLNDDGSQLRAVAHGARKPSSTFSSRLELFCHVRILLAKGKTIDIVREAKIVKSYSKIRSNIDKTFSAMPALELLEKVTQQNLTNKKLFELTINYFKQVEKISDKSYLKALCSSYLIKACSIIGFRPALSHCVVCGDEINEMPQNTNIKMNFSYTEGGLACLRCSNKTETEKISISTVSIVHKLIHIKFEDIKISTFDIDAIDNSLKFCQKWILFYIGSRIKSLDFFINNS